MRTIRDCNVCVVGGAGFLGSHLVDHLIQDRGCKVVVIDNLVAGRREFVHKDAVFEHHDITGSEEYLVGILKLHQVQFVFNFAAYPYVPDSYDRPVRVSDVNYMGALKVMNASQTAGVEAILQVSTAELYGAGQRTTGYEAQSADEWGKDLATKLGERAAVVPHSSYGAAKAAIDAAVQVRWREARTPCIALRQFNCLGERETHPYIVPEIISQLDRNRKAASCHDKDYLIPTIQLGNNSFRDFMYAGDAVRIAVELLEHGEFGQVYNLGSETGIKMYDLAAMIGKLMGFSSVRVGQDATRVRRWEIWHLQSDNTKLWNTIGRKITYNFEGYGSPSLKSVGFEPGEVKSLGTDVEQLTPLDEALKRTIDWYNANGRKWCWE